VNRRGFLKRFGIGLGAALTLAALPASAVEALTVADAGRRCACEYLRKRYNDYMRGKSYHDAPLAMFVSPGLFAAFEGELTANERFISGSHEPMERHLMFKGTLLYAKPEITTWDDVRFMPAARAGSEYAMNTTGALLA
jgi:hypothetical protein